MDLTKPIEEMSPREVRTLHRVKNLQAAAERLARRLKRNPKHPRAEKWQARLLEYQKSLANLKAHGVEVIGEGSGVKGIEIEVPTYDFTHEVHNPAEG